MVGWPHGTLQPRLVADALSLLCWTGAGAKFLGDTDCDSFYEEVDVVLFF